MNIPTQFGSNWPCGFREEDTAAAADGRHNGNTSHDPLGQVN